MEDSGWRRRGGMWGGGAADGWGEGGVRDGGQAVPGLGPQHSQPLL